MRYINLTTSRKPHGLRPWQLTINIGKGATGDGAATYTNNPGELLDDPLLAPVSVAVLSRDTPVVQGEKAASQRETLLRHHADLALAASISFICSCISEYRFSVIG